MVFCIGYQTFFPRAFAATPADGTPGVGRRHAWRGQAAHLAWAGGTPGVGRRHAWRGQAARLAWAGGSLAWAGATRARPGRPGRATGRATGSAPPCSPSGAAERCRGQAARLAWAGGMPGVGRRHAWRGQAAA
eukprot:gene23785-biopygen4361